MDDLSCPSALIARHPTIPAIEPVAIQLIALELSVTKTDRTLNQLVFMVIANLPRPILLTDLALPPTLPSPLTHLADRVALHRSGSLRVPAHIGASKATSNVSYPP